MNYIISPEAILDRTLNTSHPVKGSMDLINQCSIEELESAATCVADQLAFSWDEDQGFGSSDFTFLLQDFFMELIYTKGLHKELKTDFPNGYLEVVAL